MFSWLNDSKKDKGQSSGIDPDRMSDSQNIEGNQQNQNQQEEPIGAQSENESDHEAEEAETNENQEEEPEDDDPLGAVFETPRKDKKTPRRVDTLKRKTKTAFRAYFGRSETKRLQKQLDSRKSRENKLEEELGRTLASMVLNTKGMERPFYSEVYEQYGQDVPPDVIYEYAALAEEVMDLTEPTPQSTEWLKDYMQTNKLVQATKAKLGEGIKGLEIDLVKLPPKSSETIRTSELVINPESFDGERPKPRKWLQDFEEAIVANGWSDFLAIKYLPTFLRGSAKDWYFTEVKPKVKPTTMWYNVHELFVENYLGEADYESLSRAIENTRMRQGELVSNFIPRLRRLLLLLCPEMPESDQLRQIKDKLRPEYRPLLAFSNPRNISDLRTACMKIEAGFPPKKETDAPRGEKRTYKPGFRKNFRRSPRKPFNKVAAPRHNAKRPSPGPRQTKPKTSYQGQSKDIVCYNCNKPGHMSKDCWSKPGNSPPKSNYRNTKKVNIVQGTVGKQPERAEVMTIKHKSPSEATMPRYTVQTIKDTPLNLVVGGGKLMKHKIICNDVEIEAVVDTGAHVSAVDEEIANHFGWKPDSQGTRLVGADGKPLISDGYVTLTIKLTVGKTTKVKKHSVAIVKNLTAPMLIGLELMRDMRVKVNVVNSTLEFMKDDIRSGLRTINEEIIPARSEVTLEARAESIGLILAVPHQFENGLLIANSIDDVKDNLAQVLVANPTNKDIKIGKNSQLASIETLYEKEISHKEETDEPTAVNRIIKVDGWEDQVRVGDQLDNEQVSQLMALLKEYQHAFSIHGEIGKTSVFKHKIELLPNAQPIVEPLRRRAPVQIDETRRQVKELLKQGIIEETSSPWASAYVLAKKKNGEFRLCIDFRRLNAVTKKVVYPLPNIDECLETLSGKQYFTQLDFKSGFWQIAMDEESKELTAFRTEDGLFQFKRMPFGLTNAPASFQKMVNGVLAGLRGKHLRVFIDDVCIATLTWPEHMFMIKSTLEEVTKANLKINLAKCVFASSCVKFLGHEISQEGIRQDPDKLRALLKLPEPSDAKEVKRALGMFSYYRKFVNNFSLIAEPLTKLTRKAVDFTWGDEQRTAYRTILTELGKNATLVHFNHKDPTLVKTDASRKGVAGMLLQKTNEDWKLVTCCSRRLTASESNYGITDLEGLAVVYTLTKLRPYLLGKHFQILVDHCALCVLNKRTPNSARLRRWAIVLSEFDFEIVYTKGNLHCDIDCLSRAPVDDPTDSFLENSVYMITPFNKAEWSYLDPESREIFQKAYDKEDGLKIIDDIVYKGELLYLPADKRETYIRGVHYANMNAHPGVNATISKLKESVWWPKMYEDVAEAIKACTTCYMQKPDRNLPSGQMRSFEIYQPGEQVAIDLIEKITESHNGNQYIIVAIDMFTRFVEAKAVPDKGAPTFTQFLIEYCGRYGVPKSFLTDNSTTLCNVFTEQVIKVFGARHHKSTPYHSRGNAVVERVNQTIEEKIRLVLDDPLRSKDWDAILPIAVLAVNTSYHSSIGCSPYEMTYGTRPPLQDRDLVYKATPTDIYAKLIQLQMRELYSNATSIQLTSQERSKEYFERKHKNTLFKLNDLVAVKSPPRSSKLDPKFEGPYKVVGINNDIYTLEEPETGKTIRRHIGSLRPVKQ